MAKATKLAWPGNELPIFRGNSDICKKLNDLVNSLKGSCTTKSFGEAAIRQHIIDCLAERRQLKRGYDYSKVE